MLTTNKPKQEASKPESLNNVFLEGTQAGLAGAECWENPYVMDYHDVMQTQVWHAGWCRGRQERAAKK